ncbi:DsbA family protein [Sinisalibacter aestuarii]|uniref:Thiol-disulfide oxidoreductase n=1 Tax=Sinisalibacter aestuarii TaxID=2949426 RepID=A0ABQ5LMT1_9RHOB|nr:DsbA family protein [Sinisalibacter aestuarii]GKY86322.1 thiol-disulfide oxidoreductase [Sinisalibacter aestuarii]
MTRILPAIAALILVLAGGAWLSGRSATDALVAPALGQDAAADVELMPDYVLGDDAAPVTVIEYASFTCPHCANFHGDQFKKLKTNYIDTGKVRFIHREVYFDRFGLWGGLLANCGGEVRYFGIAGMLYDQQKDWIGSGDPTEILANLTKMGKTAGLTEEQVDACLKDEALATRLVATFQAHAETDDINATPTLIIDGDKHSNMSFNDLAAIIDEKLADS